MQTTYSTLKHNRMTPANTSIFISAIVTALLAGLFYAWCCSVVPGLKQLTDRDYITTMQSFNRAILNPVFFACFLGAVLLLPISTYLQYRLHSPVRFRLMAAATVVYLAGVFGVTMFGNVPLNDLLDKFQLSTATPAEITAFRIQFETPWNNLNLVRTIFAFICFVLVLLACTRTADE